MKEKKTKHPSKLNEHKTEDLDSESRVVLIPMPVLEIQTIRTKMLASILPSIWVYTSNTTYFITTGSDLELISGRKKGIGTSRVEK